MITIENSLFWILHFRHKIFEFGAWENIRITIFGKIKMDEIMNLGQLFPEEAPLCDDLFSCGANSLARGAPPICSVEKVSIWDSAEIFSRRQQPAWLTWRREIRGLRVVWNWKLLLGAEGCSVRGTFTGLCLPCWKLSFCVHYIGGIFFSFYDFFFLSWDCKERWWKV